MKHTNNGKGGGTLKGKKHSQGGIKAIVDGVKPVELESQEVIINANSAKKHWKLLSKINQDGGGVPIQNPEKLNKGGNLFSNFTYTIGGL